MDENDLRKIERMKYYESKKQAPEPKKRSKLPFVLIGIFLLCCMLGGGYIAARLFMPSFQVDPYFKYVDRGDPNEYALIYGDSVIPEQYYAVKFEDDILIDSQFLVDYEIDKHIFWDAAEEILTISTPLKILRLKPEEAFYTANGERTAYPISNTALYVQNEKAFVPMSFADEFYQIDYIVSEDANILVLDSTKTERNVAVASKNLSVRHNPDIKSDIAEKIKNGVVVDVYGSETDNGFLKVRTPNGTLGYAKSSELGNADIIGVELTVEDAAPMPEKYSDKKITLVWEQISGEGQKEWHKKPGEKIDIISPTWLSLSGGGGEVRDVDSKDKVDTAHSLSDGISKVRDVGSKDYVNTAQSNGYDVWPLFRNDFYDAEATHHALNSTARRQQIIDDLVAIAKDYGVSGINIDFEAYKIEDGYLYTQFLRELGVSFRLNGLISSVDLTVPLMEDSPTDRAEIGRYVDYVIVMSYDQHWATSPVAGPVAGFDWVKSGMERTLSYVPAEKVLLGLPLYTRIWYNPDGTDSLSTNDFAMQRAYDLFEMRNAQMTWEENTKYNRGEYQYNVDGALNNITSWLETTETLRSKAVLVNELNLAGVGCWSKGLEMEGVWDMLAEVIE